MQPNLSMKTATIYAADIAYNWETLLVLWLHSLTFQKNCSLRDVLSQGTHIQVFLILLFFEFSYCS